MALDGPKTRWFLPRDLEPPPKGPQANLIRLLLNGSYMSGGLLSVLSTLRVPVRFRFVDDSCHVHP